LAQTSESEGEEEEQRKKLQEEVARKQRAAAQKYLAKAQAKVLSKKRQRRRFQLGDQVLVCFNLQKKKGKGKGKVRFPYTAVVVEISQDEMYFKIRWLSRHPVTETEGEICGKQFRWDQLLLNEDDEQQGWVIQQFLMADSYNTSQQQRRSENLEKIWRQRKTQRGELEVLCTWRRKKKPSWEKVTAVGDTEQYTEFQRNVEYFDSLRQANREEEEKEQRFTVEKIFFQRGNRIFVLWENYNEPSFVEIRSVRHLEVYKKWRKEEENPFPSDEEKPEEVPSEEEKKRK
jgi:hypothetical protein